MLRIGDAGSRPPSGALSVHGRLELLVDWGVDGSLIPFRLPEASAEVEDGKRFGPPPETIRWEQVGTQEASD